MVWRSKYLSKSHRSSRSHSGGTIDLKKLYSTDGAIGNLRFKSTAAKHRPSQSKAGIPLQGDELTVQIGNAKKEIHQTAAGRKRVLEELGAMMSGKKTHY